MMHKNAREHFKLLESKDAYSLFLFVLYNLGSIPKYKILSSLLFMLRKEPFLRLCQFYGGHTVTFPTIDQLQDALEVVSLYKDVEVDGKNLDDVKADYSEETIRDFELVKDKIDSYGFK